MADIDYSKLSDEELERLAGTPAGAPNVGSMTDAQLQQLAGVPKTVTAEISPEIPPLVAGGAAATMAGIPASKIAGGAAALQYGAEKAPALIAKGTNAIKNWMGEMRPGEDKYFGGKDYGDAYSRSKIAEAVPEQHPGFRMYDANGNPLIAPERVATARQTELTKPAKSSILAPKGIPGKIMTTVAPIPATFGAGYNFAEAVNQAAQDKPVQAGISAVGGLGSLATMIPKKSFRGLGTAAAVGAPIINAIIDSTRGHADGGSIQHFDKGGATVGAVKKGAELAIDLAKKFGYNAEKVAKDYPEIAPPVTAWDPKKNKEYLAKQLSPEALAVQKARKAAQMEIEKGNYTPFFKLEDRFHVNPEHYPLPRKTIDLTLPKKQATLETHTAKASSPEAIQRLVDAYERGAVHPGAHDFYAMGQLEDAFIKELGPEAGRAAFKSRFADPLAATTGGADPNSNLMTAAYTNFVRGRGEQLPLESHQLPFPVGGRFIGGNIREAREYHNLGELNPVDNPKRYNFSSNFQGHLDRPTIDEQMMRLFDPKSTKLAPDYYAVQEQVVNDLAKQRGVTPVNFQEVAWAGGKNYEGKPMMQEINEMLHRTSRITGQPQEEVLKGFIHGNKPMYGIGAGGIGLGAASQDEVPHMAEGKSTNYLSTLQDIVGRAHEQNQRGLRELSTMTPQEMGQNVWEGAKFVGSFNPLVSAGLVGSQFIDAAKGNTGWGEAAVNAAANAPGVVGKAVKTVAPYLRKVAPYVGGLGALGAADAAEAAPTSPMKRMMGEVMEGFGPKAAKEITPGAPHTYPPQATGPWMRDYQPATGTGLPTTREGWDALAAERQALQNKVDYSMGRTGPKPYQPIQYMGKYTQGTPESRAAALAAQDDAIRRAAESKRMNYIQNIMKSDPTAKMEDLLQDYPRWESWMR